MIYLAPRQGLFAIIIFISFCIQTLLLVVSTERQIHQERMQSGEHMISQIIDETKLPLLSQDRVSLSVISARYTTDDDVAKLVIRDADGNVLVQTGTAPLQQGDKVEQVISSEGNELGSITLILAETSKGEIIASQWVFLLGSLIIYLLIWLLYGYVARPTKAQLAALSREIQEHYFAQQPTQKLRTRRDDRDGESDSDEPVQTSQNEESIVNTLIKGAGASAQSPLPDSPAPSAQMPKNVHQQLNSYMQSQRQEASVSSQVADNEPDERAKVATEATAHTSKPAPRKAEVADSMDVATIKISFSDKYNLIGKLAPEQYVPYFTLCTQLLNQGISEVLKQPIFHGVILVNQPMFDAQGAEVVLQTKNSHAKVALAAVTLAQLYVMLNEIIVVKHHELQRFAANIKVGVSDDNNQSPMSQMVDKLCRDNEVLTLLPMSGLKQLSQHIQLRNLPKPMTVYERECAFVSGVSETMVQRLVSMRDAVLLSED
ncbi:hypothetical protein [Psychrobacter sp. I-STPA6b]|uniref:hypothetical protein n=1 Tax=Psychrobacter sp. I-STPA6b TaxID=2585718 RepID=UPI001D0C3C32|nr:hypothetical protein [Psychrobacter sp. I-STPA6b]